MKGLEVSEISIKKAWENKDFRIDAEFFEKLSPENPECSWVPIGEVLEFAQYGISIEMNEEAIGFPIYRMNEIADMLCIEDIAKFANVTANDASPFVLKDRDILFNRTNSQVFVGRTGLYKPFGPEPRIFASYLIRLQPRLEIVLPEYLVAFLNSARGIRDVKRRARISINQSNVNAEEVKAIRLPLLDFKLQNAIKHCFDKAHELLIASKRAFAEAERILLQSLGLEDWQPPEPLTYTRRASKVLAAGRLDAEHFQEQFFALRRRLEEYPQGCLTMGNICPNPTNGVEIREYQEEGIPYLRVGDLQNFTVNLDKVVRISPSAAAEQAGKATLQKRDVLVSRSGSLAVTGVVEPEWSHAIISSHLIRIRIGVTGIDPYFLALFLSALPGRMQIEQYSNGGVQPEINQPSLKAILVPRLEPQYQDAIRETILRAYGARNEASLLLERAKRAVEIAIEESEMAAMKFIEESKE